MRIGQQTVEAFGVLVSVCKALVGAVVEETDVGIIRARHLPKVFVAHKEVAEIVLCGDAERFRYQHANLNFHRAVRIRPLAVPQCESHDAGGNTPVYLQCRRFRL